MSWLEAAAVFHSACELAGGRSSFAAPLLTLLTFSACLPPVTLPTSQLSDHTGETWVTAFQEQGLDIMGGRTGEAGRPGGRQAGGAQLFAGKRLEAHGNEASDEQQLSSLDLPPACLPVLACPQLLR